MSEAAFQPAVLPVAPSRTPRGAAVRAALVLLLVWATVLQRFGVNGALSGTLVVGYGFLTVAALAGALLISIKRLILYAVCMAIATASLLLNQAQPLVVRASLPSLALLGAIYLPFTLTLKPRFLADCDATWVMRFFLNLSLLCAAAGILQFYAQFFVHSDWLFDFRPYLPALLRGPDGANTVIAVGSQHKANGFFFSEPSGFSFIVALGFLAESATHKRLPRLACLALALLLSYSGTGVLTVLIGILFPIGRRTLVRGLLVGVVGGLAVWLLSDALNLSFTIARIAEFGSERSSGYIRYVAPLRLIADTWHTEAWTFWLGHGPGTILLEANMRAYRYFDPTWAKLLYEYGGLGFIAFLALVISVLRSAAVATQVRAALFFCWLVMGGHLLSAEINFLLLGLVGLLPPAVAANSSESSWLKR
jgi:hypothetical protein